MPLFSINSIQIFHLDLALPFSLAFTLYHNMVPHKTSSFDDEELMLSNVM
jgi:hypothetical protein